MFGKFHKSTTLDSVDQRTRLIGQNRLELLLFKLESGPTYAINVFKVQEIHAMLPITKVPDGLSQVVGVAKIRGVTLPVIDLGLAIGADPIRDRKSAKLIVTEYNKSTQAFMVKSVERILNLNWEEVRMPPKRAGSGHYLTAVAYLGTELLEVLDVERVLSVLSRSIQLF
jgi:two-component system, chemotaxis family, chemotaxis protein CheV